MCLFADPASRGVEARLRSSVKVELRWQQRPYRPATPNRLHRPVEACARPASRNTPRQADMIREMHLPPWKNRLPFS